MPEVQALAQQLDIHGADKGQQARNSYLPFAWFALHTVFLLLSHLCTPTQWYPETRNFMPRVPFILVGLQTDLRNDTQTLEKLEKDKKKPVTQKEAMDMAKEIGAECYLECSPRLQVGLKEIFDQVLIVTSNPRKVKAAMSIPFLKWFKGNISVYSVINFRYIGLPSVNRKGQEQGFKTYQWYSRRKTSSYL